MEFQLIDNTSLNHLDVFNNHNSAGEEIAICVAFLKNSGLKLILEKIKQSLKNKMKVTIIAGLDFYQTDPFALKQLNTLFKKYPKANLYLCQRGRSTFHPKLYYWKSKNQFHAIIGSANLTSGGMLSNHELSVSVSVDSSSQEAVNIIKYFDNLLTEDSRVVEANELAISQYKRKYDIYNKKISKAAKEAKSELDSVEILDIKIINRYLREYVAESKNKCEWDVREDNYRFAKKNLNILAKERIESKKKFLQYYEPLVGKKGEGSLWHSGSIFRSKNKVAKNYDKVLKIVRFIKSNTRKNDEYIFTNVLLMIQGVDGLGLNVITEMLQTYMPKRFSVMNKNSTGSLEFLGCEHFGSLSKKTITTEKYFIFNRVVSELAAKCNFSNLSKVDHFLNFVYWKHVKKVKKIN